eukprot:TRINITY_DN10433_c0_g1_i2.p1 TRINITY_DN10433_c0_g1~~TRINITY_DN10433_c0_g1_i2.p1  ORF type:complete len:481 (+),score=85.34 TRINITY_DN10433_c0_g1_i2:55-1497(+)
MEASEGRWLFVKSMLVTTATILGIGILALPVRVGPAGMMPFVSTFSIALVCQAAVICFVVELLQRTEMEIDVKAFTTEEMEPLEKCLSNDGDVKMRRQRSLSVEEEDTIASPSSFTEQRANLHNMAKFFVPVPALRLLFDGCVYFHFLIVMIAYAISASNAFNKLIGITREHVIMVFVTSLAALVIICDKALTSAVAAFTFFKAGLLLLMICIVSYVAYNVQRPYVDDWSKTGSAFLIGTVSLGGSINVLPVLYSSFAPTPSNIVLFRNGCLAGTLLCWALNVMWTYCIMVIVPQFGEGDHPSLERAAKHHDISTIPLLQFLSIEYPQYEFIGLVVNIFIIISVTVSFIALGLGMKHYVDGAVTATFPDFESSWRGYKLASYAFSFGFILCVALFFSHSLYILLDVFNSALLNIETGVFMAYMAYATRIKPDPSDVVPVAVQLPVGVVGIGVVLTSFYFGGAVVYDIFITAYHLVVHGAL